MRPDSKLREAITADGSSGLKAEASRFHLYIADNCPWQARYLTQSRSHDARAEPQKTGIASYGQIASACSCACGAPSAAKASGTSCRCHRVALTRAILGLEDAMTMDVLFYRRDPDRGRQFKPEVRPSTAAITWVIEWGRADSKAAEVVPLHVETLP